MLHTAPPLADTCFYIGEQYKIENKGRKTQRAEEIAIRGACYFHGDDIPPVVGLIASQAIGNLHKKGRRHNGSKSSWLFVVGGNFFLDALPHHGRYDIARVVLLYV